MKKNAFQLWKTAACLTAAVLIPLGLSALSPAAPERSVEETAPLEEQEIPVTEKSTYPYIEIHGDYRWLWGRGQFRTDSLPAPNKVRRHDERVYLATRRLRLFPFVHFDERTSLRTQLEDLRNDKEPDANHHLYLGRLYVQHEQDRLKVEAGRFNYYLLDGNVIDKKVDGLRLRLGISIKLTSWNPVMMITFWPGYFFFRRRVKAMPLFFPSMQISRRTASGRNRLQAGSTSSEKDRVLTTSICRWPSNIFFNPSSKIFWSSTMISRIMVLPHFYSNDKVRCLGQRQTAA